MARTQQYGGKEADERRTATASREERQADNAVVDGDRGQRIGDAWGLGSDYGRRCVATEFDEQMDEARSYADSQNWSEKERNAYIADCQKEAFRVMSQNTRGSTDGKRGRYKNVA